MNKKNPEKKVHISTYITVSMRDKLRMEYALHGTRQHHIIQQALREYFKKREGK